MRSEQKIVELGNYVELLFKQDHFNTLVKEFNQQSVEYALRTKPHEVKEREGVYARVNGVREFIDMMAQFVSMSDQIIETRSNQINC